MNIIRNSMTAFLLAGCAAETPENPQARIKDSSGRPLIVEGATSIVSQLSATTTAWKETSADVAEVTGSSMGVILEERDGWGPFFIRTSPLAPADATPATSAYPPAEDFPSSEWACETDQVFIQEGAVLVVRTGCRVDHLDRLIDSAAYGGDFDAAAYFVEREDGGVDLQMWVDNRLDVGIDRFRYVMRIAPEALPHDPEDLRVLFGFDDYFMDPLNNLREQPDNATWMYQVASVEGDTDRYFVRNRNKVSSMMSVHTPDWGLMLHGTDPDNADPGWLLLGSNPDDDGTLSLELGYEYKLQGEYQAGNGVFGPMQMGPTLRGQPLAAERDLDSAWWEALDAYIPFLEDETDLLPDLDLANAAYPAQWAQDCLFAVWNVGPPKDKRNYDLSRFIDEFETVVDEYESVDGEALVFCPLLWDFHTYGPRVPRPEAVALLEELQKRAVERNVELHPGTYYLPYVAETDRLEGHPMQDAIVYTAAGEPQSQGDGLVMVDQSHPALIADVMDTIESEYALGIHWAYHDNPFREMAGWREWTESRREYHVNTRDLIELMTERLTDLGGGLVAIEAGRLGLNAMQAGATGVTGSLYAGSESSNFSDALFHGRHLTAFAGDVANESMNFVFADARATAYLCLFKPVGCPYTGGQKDNVDHMPRLAMTAALGRSVIDPAPSLRDQIDNPRNPLWVQEAFQNYQTATYNAYWLRRSTPALRTGRMLPTPRSDAPKVWFASRQLTSAPGEPMVWEDQTTERRVQKYPAGLFQDVETEGRVVLVVGNPDGVEVNATVTFMLDAKDYPELMFATVWGAASTLSDDGETLSLEVTVPALDFTVVELNTAPPEFEDVIEDVVEGVISE